MTEAVSKLQVLVVDDSPVSRKLIEHTLEDGGYSPLFAKNGREALELFRQHGPAIVITDWMMTDFSGPELCERIRGGRQSPYSYIIVLTSRAEKGNVVERLAAGADDYLTKPFDPGELLARIGVGRRTVSLHREIDAKNKLLDEMAHTDSLTGLPNRRAIEAWAERQLRGAARHRFSLWVVHADLDRFKNVNDTYGHNEGDQVLKKFAEVLRQGTRASDICGRMGGDEFLLVLTHVAEQHIRPTLERFRERFAALQFSFAGDCISVTASFGVCGFQGQETPDFSDLVRRADKALYSAKRAGRNQIMIEVP